MSTGCIVFDLCGGKPVDLTLPTVKIKGFWSGCCVRLKLKVRHSLKVPN